MSVTPRVLKFYLIALLCLLGHSYIFLPQFLAAQSIQIDQVLVEGNRRIDSEVIRQQLSVTPGTLTSSEISADVKELYRTGFFDQVNAVIKDSESLVGAKSLAFQLIEKPIVRKVFIKGNDAVKESELAPIFSFGTERFFDRTKITFLMRNARALYQQKGYYDAEFDFSVLPVGDNQVDLTLTVVEGQRYKIEEIEFRGLEAIDPDELVSVMQTSTYKWWNSWLFGTGRLNQELLANDRQLIQQYFMDHGFLDATLSEAQVNTDDGEIKIVFEVEEGNQYKIGEIRVTGDLIDDSPQKTLDGVKSSSGEIFSATTAREDAFTITDKFTDKGYAFANVVPQTRINPELELVNLEYQVAKGLPVSVNRIRIRGNTKTYDNVIRRELRLVEQELYSSSKIRRSEELLQRLGYFEEVDISTEPTGADDQVDLLVNVREASTGTFSVGAGFSSSDGALFNTRLTENNLFGSGKRVVANADIGTEREQYILNFLDPRFRDSFWSLGVEGFLTEREFTDFDRQLDGAGVSFGYPLEETFGEWAQDISFSLEYQYFGIDILNVDEENAAPLVLASRGRSTASGITPSLVRNTINNPLNPTRGSRQELSVELTGLGGSEEYYQVEAANQWYQPLGDTFIGELIFSWRTRVGYGETYDGEPFPLFRRYFPGGINSVRGFEARTLGPRDENGNEFGGSSQFVNNLEIIFPLLDSAGLKGVVFYDIGEAFDDNQSIRLRDLRQAYGAGVRWNSPLGPIRIEFGFPIDKEEGEDSAVTLFSLGAPF